VHHGAPPTGAHLCIVRRQQLTEAGRSFPNRHVGEFCAFGAFAFAPLATKMLKLTISQKSRVAIHAQIDTSQTFQFPSKLSLSLYIYISICMYVYIYSIYIYIYIPIYPVHDRISKLFSLVGAGVIYTRTLGKVALYVLLLLMYVFCSSSFFPRFISFMYTHPISENGATHLSRPFQPPDRLETSLCLVLAPSPT